MPDSEYIIPQLGSLFAIVTLSTMAHIYVTRKIPEEGIVLLKEAGHTVSVSKKDEVLTREELLSALKKEPYDAVLCTLNNTIDSEVMDAVPTAKIFANYAVGYDNIDLDAARERGVTVTNTPGVLTDAVAEHTVALMFALARRVPESDRFVRAGKYTGWGPMLLLGTQLKGSTLGLLGAGRIGTRVAEIASCLGMQVIYYDVKRNEILEKNTNAVFHDTAESVLQSADVVSVHVPLLDSTRHLLNAERLALMKKTALLINTSRGPVVDEVALVGALQEGGIRGAALDVFEHEPALAPGLAELENVILTPHTASATEEARGAMSRIAAENIIAHLNGEKPENSIT